MTTHVPANWDWKSLLTWLIAHLGVVITGMMVVLAWWKRRGNSHLRGLRVQVRFQGIDCLQWAATRWFSPSRAYWLLRYPCGWEIASTLREGLQNAGVLLSDGVFRQRLQREIRHARREGLFQRFRRAPDTTEVRTPIEDCAAEMQLFDELASAVEQRGWTALATAIRATAPAGTDSLLFQAICDIWLRSTQSLLLDIVFRQIEKLGCQLRQVDRSLECLSQLTQRVAELRGEFDRLQHQLQPLTAINTGVEGVRVEIQNLDGRLRDQEQAAGLSLDARLSDYKAAIDSANRLAARTALFATLTFLCLGGLIAFFVWATLFR